MTWQQVVPARSSAPNVLTPAEESWLVCESGRPIADADSLLASQVMIVDDERGNLLLLEEILHRAGLPNVSGFRDPEEALDAAIHGVPDLILLDIRMPGLDGYAFLASLRERLPQSEVPPVLMMTGDTSSATKLHALEVGVADFVTKPFDSSELLLRIRNALRAQALQVQIRTQNQRLERAVQERTRQLEEALFHAESANRAKAEFLAKMSHELKTPLTPLLGALEMMADTEQSVMDARLVEIASRNADRLNRLVSDILLLQRLEQGTMTTDVTSVRIASLLKAVLEPFAVSSASEIRLEAVLTEEHATVRTDETHLADIVRRIVENAVRFSPSESTVTIRLETDPDDSPIAIVVADEGPGIPEDRLEAMFAAFEQLDNSSVRPHNGAGLGLAICNKLCNLIGATLGASAGREGGTNFRIGLESLDRPRPA
jgi:signal transduction histidine kinase